MERTCLLFYEILFLFSFSMLSFTHRNNISIKPLMFLLLIKDSIQDVRKEEELDDDDEEEELEDETVDNIFDILASY